MNNRDFPSAEKTPTRTLEFEANDLPDGVVLFDAQGNIAHHLNPIATLVWELIDGRSRASIVEAVGKVLEVDDGEAEGIVTAALGQLVSIGAVR